MAFLNLTFLKVNYKDEEQEDETDGPFLVNMDHIVTIKRDENFRTKLLLQPGGFVLIKEDIAAIMEAMDHKIIGVKN